MAAPPVAFKAAVVGVLGVLVGLAAFELLLEQAAATATRTADMPMMLTRPNERNGPPIPLWSQSVN
jgi:hypothetical protein